MSVEIERKFLLNDTYNIHQLSYVTKYNIDDTYVTPQMRIRHKDDDSFWTVTIKGKGNIERTEWELRILTKPYFENVPPLQKTRLIIPYNNQNFEVNVFKHIYFKNKPLVIIELELQDKDQVIQFPDWVGEEVTYDPRFYGHELANFLRFYDFSIVK